MRTAMLLLTVTVLSVGPSSRTNPDKAARQNSAQTDRRDRALRDGVARGRRTDLRHQRLGDFYVPETNHAYA